MRTRVNALEAIRSIAEASYDPQLAHLISMLDDFLLEVMRGIGESWDEPDGYKAGSIACMWLTEFLNEISYDTPPEDGLGLSVGVLFATEQEAFGRVDDIARRNARHSLTLELAELDQEIEDLHEPLSRALRQRKRVTDQLEQA